MATINVKLAASDVTKIIDAVSRGDAMSKSDFVRRAIIEKLSEDRKCDSSTHRREIKS